MVYAEPTCGLVPEVERRCLVEHSFQCHYNTLTSLDSCPSLSLSSCVYAKIQYEGQPRHIVPPHVYALTDCAYNNLFTMEKNQCIVIRSVLEQAFASMLTVADNRRAV